MGDFKEIIENIIYSIEQSDVREKYCFAENDDGKVNIWIDKTGRLYINGVALPYTTDDMMEVNFHTRDCQDNDKLIRENYVKLSFIDNRTLYLCKGGIEMVERRKLFHDTKAILARLNYIYRSDILGQSINPLIIKDRVVLAYCGKSYGVIIPEGVLRIGRYAFEHSDVSMVRFPSSIQEIGDYAFCNCKKLIDLLFDEEEEYIGFEVFDGSEKVIEESVPDRINANLKRVFEGADLLNVSIGMEE